VVDSDEVDDNPALRWIILWMGSWNDLTTLEDGLKLASLARKDRLYRIIDNKHTDSKTIVSLLLKQRIFGRLNEFASHEDAAVSDLSVSRKITRVNSSLWCLTY
jgi:hypothetical protein